MLIAIKEEEKVYQVCQINHKMTVHVAQGEKKKKGKEKENLKEHAATMFDTKLLSQQKKKKNSTFIIHKKKVAICSCNAPN